MNRLAPALLAVLALGACGKKASPISPSLRVPAPVADLRAEVRGGAVELTWTNPVRRGDNKKLHDIVAARVYRTDDDGVADPRPALLTQGRIAGYIELLTLTAMPTQPGTVPPPLLTGGRVQATDRRDLTQGRRYTYVVIVEDGEGRVSPPSPRVSVTFMSAPDTPQELIATPGPRQVRLSWQPPARLGEGGPAGAAVLYEVLRAPAPGAPAQVITASPLAATEFVDGAVENGRTYYYTVQALRRAAGTLARGPATAPVSATPIDRTPPAPPRDLVATPSGTGVQLRWSGTADADVAGYIVYRAAAGREFERVGSTVAPTTTFVDRDVPPGTYRYAVTTQDATARAVESARSQEATITLPAGGR
jgi:fibronectin type 3 domain-containing protein